MRADEGDDARLLSNQAEGPSTAVSVFKIAQCDAVPALAAPGGVRLRLVESADKAGSRPQLAASSAQIRDAATHRLHRL